MKRVFLYALITLTQIFSVIPLLYLFYFLYFQKEGEGGVADIVFNAALFVAFGMIHSLLAHDFSRKFMARLVGSDYVRTVYVIIAGITLSLMLYFWRPISGTLWHTDGILYWVLSFLYLGCVVAMFSTTFFTDSAHYLGIRTLSRIIRNRPQKPDVFSTRGPYAYCRHPMYLFQIIAFWLGPVMTYGRLEFACLASIYILIGTRHEERNLRQELGPVYDIYRANVPKWIPRLRPWHYEGL